MRATLRARTLVLIGVLTIFIGLSAGPARAATVVVNSVPQLVSALAAAAAGTGPTDIRIKAGTYEISSTLSLKSPPGGAIVTLQDAGDGTVVLHSTSRGRILHPEFQGNYLVKGLTFSGGGETATINSDASTLTIADCTFVDNVLAFYTDSSRGVIELINDTFTQNQQAIQLDSHSSVKIRNSTIANNNSTINPFQQVGIGIGAFWGAADVLANSIVFGNNRSDCRLFPLPSSIVNSIDGDGTCGARRIDPKLVALADNGGLVKTMALLPNSPAVGAGSSTYCPPADARGAGRPAPPAGCDIGAFQRSGNFQLESATGAGPVSFATGAGTFINFHAVSESTLPTAGKPSGVTFPFGFFDWKIIDLTPGQTVTVTVTFPSPPPTPPQYWKIDSAGTWMDLCRALTCTVVGTNQLKFAITDGGPGDFDNSANGEIRDPGGLGVGGIATTTTTTVTSSANPSVFGQAVSFTALVASGAATPTGTVQFAIDGASFGVPVAIDASGRAHSASISTLGVGPHDVQATYSGSGTASTGSLAGGQVVNRAPTTTTARSSANPSVFGQPVSFTAAVAVVVPGAGSPTGTVEFAVDGVVLGTVALDSTGTATFNTASLAVGSHTITETYRGDGDFAASFSRTLAQAVGKAATSVGLVTSSSTVGVKQPVTFSATVAAVPPGSGTPSGTVVFQDGAITLGSAVLDKTGVARFTTSTLALGSHTITALYAGNDTFSASTAPVLTQTIAIATTMTITSSSNPSLAFQDITFTATISFANPLSPTTAALFRGAPGDIQLRIDGGSVFFGSPVLNAPDQTGNFASASVVAQVQAPLPGRHTIAAQYSCTSPTCIVAGSSSVLTQTVNPIATTMTITSSSNPSLAGQTTTFTATISFASPLSQVSAPAFRGTPGDIQLRIDGNSVFFGSPVLNAPDQTGNFASASVVAQMEIPSPYAFPGRHTIAAQYSCTQPLCIVSGSSSTLTQTVNPVATTMTITSSSNPSLAGQAITFTATISFASPLNQLGALGLRSTPGDIQFQIDGVFVFQGSPVLNAPDQTGNFASASVVLPVPNASPATFPGRHTIAAQYSCTQPLCIVSGSSSVLTQTVNNTPAGSNVSVSPADASGNRPASVTFSNVTRAGLTSLTISNNGAAPPAGFELGTPPTYFDLSTTAVFSGSITVCINYRGITFANPPPRLFHFENGAWIDVTISLDTTRQLVCGMVTSLSPFAIFQTNTLPGRMHGEGSVDAGGLRHHFEFRVKKRAGGKLLGSFQYEQQASGSRDSKGEDEDDQGSRLNRFVSSAITFAGFSGAPPTTGHLRNQPAVNSVTFGGLGRWNGARGFTFEVTAKRPRGEPGIIAITIRAAGGAIVASVTGTLRDEDSEAPSENDHRESDDD